MVEYVNEIQLNLWVKNGFLYVSVVNIKNHLCWMGRAAYGTVGLDRMGWPLTWGSYQCWAKILSSEDERNNWNKDSLSFSIFIFHFHVVMQYGQATAAQAPMIPGRGNVLRGRHFQAPLCHHHGQIPGVPQGVAGCLILQLRWSQILCQMFEVGFDMF